MALIACAECSKEISDKATACPSCGAPVPPAPVTVVASPGATGEASKYTLLAAAASIGLMTFVAVSCVGGKDTAKHQIGEISQSEALTMCQYALKKASRDPSKADVPYVPNHGSGDEFYFAWGQSTKRVRLLNGLGVEVAATASALSASRKSASLR